MGGRVESADVALGLVVSTHHVDAVDEGAILIAYVALDLINPVELHP